MIDSNILKIYSIGKYITAQTATEATGYNLQYLRRLLRVGKITGVKIGQVWLIEFDSLKAYLKLNNDSVDKRCGPKKFRSKQCILILTDTVFNSIQKKTKDFGGQSLLSNKLDPKKVLLLLSWVD